MTADLTVAILAGGRSSRMGTDKSFVRVLPERGPLIEHILAQVVGLGDEALIVTNQPDEYAYLGLPLFADVLPDKGALGGLYSALQAAQRRHILCIACDMPFIVRPLLDYLLSLRAEGVAVVPRLAGQPEPFRAIYQRDCQGTIRNALDAGRLRVTSIFSEMQVRYVDEAEINRFDPDHLSFVNVNTPADLEQAQRLAAQP
jgi:molybdopterin-guanine dinucleotide biosynthesis protein A